MHSRRSEKIAAAASCITLLATEQVVFRRLRVLSVREVKSIHAPVSRAGP